MKDAYVLGDASLAKIATDFGVSVPTIAKYLRREGVDIKGRGRPRKKALEPAEETTPFPKLEEGEDDPIASVDPIVESPVFDFPE
jgi:transposase